MNQAVKDPDDAGLVLGLTRKLRTLDAQELPDDSGKLAKVPTVQVEPKAVTWERDTTQSPPLLHVYFEYTRDVPYPLLQRWTDKTLSVDLTEELTRADWGSGH